MKKKILAKTQLYHLPTCIHASVSYKDFSKEKPDIPSDVTKSSTSSPTRDHTWNELLANINQDDGNNELKSDSRSMSYSDSIKMSDSDNSDDEFFEAREEISVEQLTVTVPEEPIEEIDNLVADGVFKETDMKLLINGKPLNIPITQVNLNFS